VTLDYVAIISEEGGRIADAYERDRTAAVPWSDRWSVGTVARHVAGTHHVVAEIVRDRPDADFGRFAGLETPAKDAPDFPAWFRTGTAALVEQLSTVPADEACWSWYEPGRRVGWWARRMALEAVVHRFDTDAALQQDFVVSSDLAVDGVDEYLDVFVAATRGAQTAPAGPVIGFECTDADGSWSLDLSGEGRRNLSRESSEGSVRVRGTAQQLLLAVWGRVPIAGDAGLEVSGDASVLDRWAQLVPPM
jgi:uncharacterized protein (TIGR03083 family)